MPLWKCTFGCLALATIAAKLPAAEISLAALLEEARERNPSLRAARSRLAARAELHPQVTSLPDPMLQLSYQLESVETRVGPQRGSLGLTQTFPMGGKLRLRGQVATRQVELAAEALRRAELEVEARLRKAYYDYWFTGRSQEITREMMELLRSGEQVARTRYSAGRTAQEVVLKAQVEIGVLEDRIRTLEELEPTQVEAILALLDREPGGDLGVPAPGDLAEREVVPSLDQLYARAARLAPEVRGLEIQAEQKTLEEKLAGKARVPDLTFGVSWIRTDEALNPSTAGSGTDPVLATLALNLPLRKARYRAAERQRAREREALEQAREGEVNALVTDLKRAYFTYTDARRKLSLYRDSLVPKGRQSLEATFTAFQAGRAGFLDLLDAERVLLDFQLSLTRSLAEHLKAIAEIERMVAEPVSQEVSP